MKYKDIKKIKKSRSRKSSDKIAKYQFGGSGNFFDYFKGIYPNILNYQGQSNGQSNLYGNDAQNYFKGLVNNNQQLANGNINIGDNNYQNGSKYSRANGTYIDFNNPNSYNNSTTSTVQSPRGNNNATSQVVRGTVYNGSRAGVGLGNNNRATYTNPDGTINTGGVNSDIASEFNTKLNTQKTNAITETGANIFSLLKGQEAYDNKPLENLKTSSTGNAGFKYLQFGGGNNTPTQNITPQMLSALQFTESGYNPDTVGITGDLGLNQHNPKYVNEFAQLHNNGNKYDPMDPYQSSIVTANKLNAAPGNDDETKVAIYNAGESRVAKAMSKAGSSAYKDYKIYLPKGTQNYVKKIKKNSTKLGNQIPFHEVLKPITITGNKMGPFNTGMSKYQYGGGYKKNKKTIHQLKSMMGDTLNTIKLSDINDKKYPNQELYLNEDGKVYSINGIPQGFRVNKNVYSNYIKELPEQMDTVQVAQPFQYGGVTNPNLINLTGYTPGTSTYNNPFNIIPSSNISMKNTPFPILAQPNKGKAKILKPGKNYNFNNADFVKETPLKNFQFGGIPKALIDVQKQLNPSRGGIIGNIDPRTFSGQSNLIKNLSNNIPTQFKNFTEPGIQTANTKSTSKTLTPSDFEKTVFVGTKKMTLGEAHAGGYNYSYTPGLVADNPFDKSTKSNKSNRSNKFDKSNIRVPKKLSAFEQSNQDFLTGNYNRGISNMKSRIANRDKVNKEFKNSKADYLPYKGTIPDGYTLSGGLYGQSMKLVKNDVYEKDRQAKIKGQTTAVSLAIPVPGGAAIRGAKQIITKIPGAGKVVKYGTDKFINAAGTVYNKSGKVIQNATKSTKEFFKKGTSESFKRSENLLNGKIPNAAIKNARTGRFEKISDTRGTLQRIYQDNTISNNVKAAIQSTFNTGKKISQKAYNTLKPSDKTKYDKLVKQMMKDSAKEIKNKTAEIFGTGKGTRKYQYGGFHKSNYVNPFN